MSASDLPEPRVERGGRATLLGIALAFALWAGIGLLVLWGAA